MLVETESRRAPRRKRKFIVIIDSRTHWDGLGWVEGTVQGVNQRRRDSAVPAWLIAFVTPLYPLTDVCTTEVQS